MLFHKIEEVRAEVQKWRKEGLTVGLVPTMGALHNGHLSLIKKAKETCDKVVVSDFVNPIQFGPSEDFDKYPRTLDADMELCNKEGVDIVFAPSADEMYGEGQRLSNDTLTYVCPPFFYVNTLCGKSRTGHFDGVCTVVLKLFNIVQPDYAFFGQKDAQQLAVIKHMVDDLNFNLEIVGCPIVREADGLAKSSRNTYLSTDERKAALVLSQSLKLAEEMIASGEKDTEKLKQAMTDFIEKEPLAKIDYVEFVDWKTLEPVEVIDRPVLNAIAVYIGKTRLIDNHIYE